MSDIATALARRSALEHAAHDEASAGYATGEALSALAAGDLAFAASRAADAAAYCARAATYREFVASLPAPPPSGVTFTFNLT